MLLSVVALQGVSRYLSLVYGSFVQPFALVVNKGNQTLQLISDPTLTSKILLTKDSVLVMIDWKLRTHTFLLYKTL